MPRKTQDGEADGWSIWRCGKSPPVWYSEPGPLLMRWLLIVLLVSLAALLIAAAGMTLHIWVRRARVRKKPSAKTGSAAGKAEETDVETEI